MKTLFKIFFVSLLLSIFAACNNNDNDFEYYNVDIATVENPNNLATFFFRLDNDMLMWTSASEFRNYRPDDGQRIIAYYTLLSDKRATGLYNYDVKLENVYEVLTKSIFAITPEKQDSIGNDSISIQDLWIGSDYLNVRFLYQGNNRIHFINLVSDAAKQYADGKIHLEFRHNANDDAPLYYRKGIVSFNIKSLQNEVNSTSLDIVMHVNVPNQAAERTYSLTYNFGDTETIYRALKMLSPIEMDQNGIK